jgi:hypothetical protein
MKTRSWRVAYGVAASAALLVMAGQPREVSANVIGLCDDAMFVSEHRYVDGAGWSGGNLHEEFWNLTCANSVHVEDPS